MAVSMRPHAHFAPQNARSSPKYSLLYTWGGLGSEGCADSPLLAHQDVVPVAPGTEKDWQQAAV